MPEPWRWQAERTTALERLNRRHRLHHMSSPHRRHPAGQGLTGSGPDPHTVSALNSSHCCSPDRPSGRCATTTPPDRRARPTPRHRIPFYCRPAWLKLRIIAKKELTLQQVRDIDKHTEELGSMLKRRAELPRY